MRIMRLVWICLMVLIALSGSVLAATPRSGSAHGSVDAARVPAGRAIPGGAHSVHLAGVAPMDYFVRVYVQQPGQEQTTFYGAPSMGRTFDWSLDVVLQGEGDWGIRVGAKDAAGAWLYFLDSFTLTTSATTEIKTLVLQQGADGYAGTTDCYISDWVVGDTDNAYGVLDPGVLRLRKVDRKEVLLRFELEGLPANAHIHHAFVAMYAFLNTNPSGPTYFAYQLLRPWAEDQATWNSPRAGETWAEPGAMNVTYDRKAEHTDKLCRPPAEPGDTCGEIIPGWHQLDITASVQNWVDGEPNYGVLVRSWDPYWASSAENSFFSSEANQPEYRPKLIVYYSEAEAVPTSTPSPTPSVTPSMTPSPTATLTLTPTPPAVRLSLPLIWAN
ncbi:MAG: DNRLRE domain-containing protein [Anaerolineaceae bacterium]|nr:DNRLRE domain-containing protein [Anaerolineaceae bacterium]